MIKSERKTPKVEKPLTLEEAVLQLKKANEQIAEQATRFKNMEEDSLAFQDFIITEVLGGM